MYITLLLHQNNIVDITIITKYQYQIILETLYHDKIFGHVTKP